MSARPKKSMVSYPSREEGNPSKQKSTMRSEDPEKHLTFSWFPEGRCHNTSLPAEEMKTRHTHTPTRTQSTPANTYIPAKESTNMARRRYRRNFKSITGSPKSSGSHFIAL